VIAEGHTKGTIPMLDMRSFHIHLGNHHQEGFFSHSSRKSSPRGVLSAYQGKHAL
jgi:hypothetical protein